MFDSIFIVVSREEVAACDTSNALVTLNSLMETPEKAKMLREAIEISFAGYENDSRELFEIEEVRNFVFELDDEFPYWLYFLTKFGTGLQFLYLCKMPPYLTEEAKAEIFPQRLAHLLENRWLPAMNHMCEYTGMRGGEVEALTQRGLSYLIDGPFRLSPDGQERDAGNEDKYRQLVPAFLKVIDAFPAMSREDMIQTFKVKVRLRYTTEQASQLQPYIDRFFEEYFPNVSHSQEIATETQNNKWRHGDVHFALPPMPTGFMRSGGVYHLQVTLDPEVGEEVVLIIYDPTDFIYELAELTPFNFHVRSVAINTTYGPQFVFLFWVAQPHDERRIFAGFDKPVDISKPASIEPWIQIQRQTHLHVLLVDASHEVQGFYEFENDYGFDNGVEMILQLDPKAVIDPDKARQEYFTEYSVADLIELVRTNTEGRPKT